MAQIKIQGLAMKKIMIIIIFCLPQLYILLGFIFSCLIECVNKREDVLNPSMLPTAIIIKNTNYIISITPLSLSILLISILASVTFVVFFIYKIK